MFPLKDNIPARNFPYVNIGLIVINSIFFIRDLYSHYGLNYNDYVIENLNKFNEYEIRKEYYLKSNDCQYSYNQLFKDTISDIDKKFNQVKGITLL